jgi:glycosyltransferase involved in cell wall biosynthesis
MARFDRIKNLPCIIRGFQLFKKMNPDVDAGLVLVGTGPLLGEIRAIAADTDCAALIALPGEAMHPEEWYSRFDIYINASFSEGMSNTILEGMACGLPIVASDVPGNRCWLEQDVNALFFASDNAEELARHLASLARDPGLLRRLGDENRRLAERAFDDRDFVGRYHRLYQELLRE